MVLMAADGLRNDQITARLRWLGAQLVAQANPGLDEILAGAAWTPTPRGRYEPV